MTRSTTLLTLFVVLLFAAPAVIAADDVWHDPADASGEPDHPLDTADVMWQMPNDEVVDRIYFNGYVETFILGSRPPLFEGDAYRPPQLMYPRALLGYWRDCNHDGYVGNALLGTEEYPDTLGGDHGVCPEGSPYNKDGLVTEFLWIGPRANGDGSPDRPTIVNSPDRYHAASPVGTQDGGRGAEDPDARVWADWGVPGDEPRKSVRVFPFPQGSLSSWSGHAGYPARSPLPFLPDAVNETGEPAGVGYGPVYQVARTLDSTGVPSPVAVTKHLVNDSRTRAGGDPDCGYADHAPCGGAYAQPLVVVWDCRDDAGATTVPVPRTDAPGTTEDRAVAPPVSPHVNANGSLTGTLYQNTRPRILHGDASNAGACGAGEGLHPYNNLEHYNEDAASQDKKASHDHVLFFTPGSRFDERTPEEHGTPVPYTGLVEDRDTRAGVRGAATFFHFFGVGDDTGWLGATYAIEPVGADAPEAAVVGDVRKTRTVTFYAYVSSHGLDAMGASAFYAFPGGNTLHQYGDDACTSFDASGESDAWTCDPAKWTAPESTTWAVRVGQPYQLRDVDCYDATLVGFTTPRPRELDAAACPG